MFSCLNFPSVCFFKLKLTYEAAPPGDQAEDIFRTIQDARAAHAFRAARRAARDENK